MTELNEVSPEEIKAFMNEPEEPKAPAPLIMDDWEPETPVKDYKLTTEQIAATAFRALNAYEGLQDNVPMQAWIEAPDHMRQHYVSKVAYFIQTAANPNGYEECLKMHDVVLEAKLKSGFNWGEEYSQEAKTDPTLLPYSRLPAHVRVKDFLFRNVVISLLQVWKGH